MDPITLIFIVLIIICGAARFFVPDGRITAAGLLLVAVLLLLAARG